jgi:hypothetical protein
MLQLAIAYLHQLDREREIATDLRRRERLKLLDQRLEPIDPRVHLVPDPRRVALRARPAGR